MKEWEAQVRVHDGGHGVSGVASRYFWLTLWTLFGYGDDVEKNDGVHDGGVRRKSQTRCCVCPSAFVAEKLGLDQLRQVSKFLCATIPIRLPCTAKSANQLSDALLGARTAVAQRQRDTAHTLVGT